MNEELRMQNEELHLADGGAGWPCHNVPAAQASKVASAFAWLRRDRTRPCPPPRRWLSFVKLCKALEFKKWRAATGQRGEAPSVQAPTSRETSSVQHPSTNLPGRCPAVFAEGHQPGGSSDKTSKLRNEPILEMRLSPDFTDVKWRF